MTMDYQERDTNYATDYNLAPDRVANTNNPNTSQSDARKQKQLRRRCGFFGAIGRFFVGLWRAIKYTFIALSLLGNLILLLLIIMAITVGYAGFKGKDSFGKLTGATTTHYKEHIIQKGNPQTRIAVIEIAGIITEELLSEATEQFDAIAEDKSVCGVIVKIQSPGGLVSPSDNLHYQIQKLSRKRKIPIVAFASGLAASGGYYAALACDEIIAEPTTITGSIGVILQTFTLKELFETKLGITAVTIKSGEKKDWPNSFRNMSEKEIEYLDEKLIRPAYQRFVDLAVQGRQNLTREQLLPLADGSIFPAQEAYEKGLIDGIGYFERAVKSICEKAEISDPQVFGFSPIFSISDLVFLQSQGQKNILTTGKDMITQLQSPALMYLWTLE